MTMMQIQTDIIAPISAHAIYLHCTRNPAIDAASLLQTLRNASEQLSNNQLVLGLGASLLGFLEVDIPGMRRFPDLSNSHIDMHAFDIDLWIWLKAEERGQLFHLTQKVKNLLAPNFEVNQQVDAYQYQGGRDLTGYEDGTENPQDEAALECAFIQSDHAALNGSSMVAVQRWQHSFAAFHAMSETQQDHMVGRRLSDNEELEDAPESAHVKRTAQESFTPEAFILRRSMPWSSHDNAGLYFTAFGKSFDAFEAQLRRMLGLEDGIVDALFQISTPMISSYFWCPPMQQGRLNLSALVNSENLNR
jgi:putative iron-dependent peroxidase